MSNWADFDSKVSADFVNDVKNASVNSGDFEELPLGSYEVAVTSMELKTSKAGDPMVATCFKIVEGEYENRLIFKNSVVYKGDDKDTFRISNELKFLKSLGTSYNVSFEGFAKFDSLIQSIFAEISKNKIEYLLEIVERKGFRNYIIREIYEDEKGDLPF